jgi:hypothetical protein
MSLRISPLISSAGGFANSIDWAYIREEEGDIRELYIPAQRVDKSKLSELERNNPDNYKPIGRSGVTISIGVDLAQQNLPQLLSKIPDAAIRESLRRKLSPFAQVGNRGSDAVRSLQQATAPIVSNFQRNNPELASALNMPYGDSVVLSPEARQVAKSDGQLTKGRVLAPSSLVKDSFRLTDPEAEALFKAVSRTLGDDLIAKFNKLAEPYKLQFASLPAPAQTAMMSLRYQTGSRPGGKSHAAFWQSMARGDLKAAVKEFEREVVKSAPSYAVKRRKRELQMLQMAAASWNAAAGPDVPPSSRKDLRLH